MGTNPDPLPDECDFCKQEIDEDEQLVPVYVGEYPNPRPQYFTSTSESLHSHMTWGYSAGEVAALLTLLEEADTIEYDMTDRVREMPDMKPTDLGNQAAVPVETKVNKDKSSATLRIEADYDKPNPDMMVCEFCRESFGKTEEKAW